MMSSVPLHELVCFFRRLSCVLAMMTSPFRLTTVFRGSLFMCLAKWPSTVLDMLTGSKRDDTYALCNEIIHMF